MRYRLTLCVVFIVLCVSSGVALGKSTVELVMTDGVALATDIYAESFDPQPVLIIRTADGRGNFEALAEELTTLYDVKVVVQDIRGHGDSEGEESMFSATQADGLETVEYIDLLGWSNGIVGTYGRGVDAVRDLLVSQAGGASISCQYFESGSGDFAHSGIYEGGVRRVEWDLWATVQGASWVSQDWNLHPEPADPYWDTLTLNPTDAATVTAGGLHRTGWFDVLLRGAVDAFRTLQDSGGPGAAGRQRLIIGPWNYAGVTTQRSYPDADGSELESEWQKAWAAACLHGESELFDALPEALVYVMGADTEGAAGNRWEVYEAWPPPSTETSLYLRAKGELSVEQPEVGELGQIFEHLPEDPTPVSGGRNLRLPSGSSDQQEIEGRDEVAVYTSAPLKDPVEIVGNLRARLWVLSDKDVVDVVVRLTDVYPDGRSLLIASGLTRVGGQANEQLVEVDLWPTAMVFETGHRIRVSIAGAMKGAFELAPERFSGVVVSNAEFVSHIILPVISGLESELPPEIAEGDDIDAAADANDGDVVDLDAIDDVEIGPVVQDTQSTGWGDITPEPAAEETDTAATATVQRQGCGGCDAGMRHSQGVVWMTLSILAWMLSRRRGVESRLER